MSEGYKTLAGKCCDNGNFGQIHDCQKKPGAAPSLDTAQRVCGHFDSNGRECGLEESALAHHAKSMAFENHTFTPQADAQQCIWRRTGEPFGRMRCIREDGHQPEDEHWFWPENQPLPVWGQPKADAARIGEIRTDWEALLCYLDLHQHANFPWPSIESLREDIPYLLAELERLRVESECLRVFGRQAEKEAERLRGERDALKARIQQLENNSK